MNSSESAPSNGRHGRSSSTLDYKSTEITQEGNHPDGSQRKPGSSCKELRTCHPDFKDGEIRPDSLYVNGVVSQPMLLLKGYTG